MSKERTKAYFDKTVFFMDQKDFVVYQGQMAHFHGCPRFGGIPFILAPDAIVMLIGIDFIVLREDGSEREYRIKDAPGHWRDAGIEWAKARHGCDYDSLPDGDVEAELPRYDVESYYKDDDID